MSKPYQETIKLDRNQTQDQDTEPEALIHPSSLVPGTYQLMIAQELDFDGVRSPQPLCVSDCLLIPLYTWTL